MFIGVPHTHNVEVMCIPLTKGSWFLDEALEACDELEGTCGNLDNLLEYDQTLWLTVKIYLCNLDDLWKNV